MLQRPLLGAGLVFTATVLWATLGIFARHLYAAGLTPLELASVRAAVTSLGLGLWMLGRPSRFRIRPADLPFFILYGLIGVAIFEFLYFATIERTTVSVAVALLYTAPAFVVLLSWIFLRERVGRADLVALGLVLAGVLLVTGALRLVATSQAPVPAAALGLGLASGLTYGLYTLFGKYALTRYDAIQTVFFPFLAAALLLAFIAPPWRPMVANPATILPLLALGLFPTLAAYLLYIGALRHLPASRASMLASIEPVMAALLGLLLLGETMGLDQVAGMALVVSAALLLARRPPLTHETAVNPAPFNNPD